MHDWAPRSGALLASLLLHALLIAKLYTWTLVQPQAPNLALLPVSVLMPAAPALPPAEPALPQTEPAEALQPQAPPEPPPAKIPLPERQIVSPPDGGENQAPLDTRFLSDRDVTVEEQMVRRGEPAPGSDESQEAAPGAQADDASEEQDGGGENTLQAASSPALEQLLPDALQLAELGFGQTHSSAEVGDDDAQQRRAEQRHSGGWWSASLEPLGTLDFLPDVRHGDITLLNTKAELFAPFVRRVALRVFQHLMISIRHELLRSGLTTSTESVEAEAVMDARGEMIAFRITQRSGSIALSTDRKLQHACNEGFFDRNPPPGAAAKDGNIHFLLRTHVAAIAHPRGYRVGYRAMFQAGLM